MEDTLTIQEILSLLLKKWRAIILITTIGAVAGCLFAIYSFVKPVPLQNTTYTSVIYASVEYLSDDNLFFNPAITGSQIQSIFTTPRVYKEIVSSLTQPWEIVCMKLNIILPESIANPNRYQTLSRKMEFTLQGGSEMFVLEITGEDKDLVAQINQKWYESGTKAVEQYISDVKIHPFETYIHTDLPPIKPTLTILNVFMGIVKKSLLFGGAGFIAACAFYGIFILLSDCIKGSFSLTRRYSIDLLGCVDRKQTESFAEISVCLQHKLKQTNQKVFSLVSSRTSMPVTYLDELVSALGSNGKSIVTLKLIDFTQDLEKKIDAYCDEFDCVIIDCTSAVSFYAILCLVQKYSHVVFCECVEKSKFSVIDTSLQKIQNIDGVVLGFILKT